MPHSARNAWAVVAILWFAYLLNYIDRQVVFSILPALRSDLGFTNAELGLVGSMFLWVYALSSPLAGRLVDRLPRERMVAASLILWSLATLGTALSGSPASFLFWRAVMGLTEALYFPAAVSLLGAVHPGATRSRALALHGSAQLAGIAVGGWFGGFAADTFGWRSGLLALAAAGVLYAPVTLLALPRLPVASPASRSVAGPAQLVRATCYAALLVAFFNFCILLWMLYAWLPNWIYERYGLSMAASGFTATIYLQASSAVGILSGGVLGDWVVRRLPAGRFYVAALGLLAASPFAYLTLAAPSLGWLKLAAAGFGLFAGLVMANTVASAYEVIAPENHGLAAGTLNFVGGLSGGLAVFLAGRWKDSVGVGTLMGFAAAASGAAAVLLAAVVALRFAQDRRRAFATLEA